MVTVLLLESIYSKELKEHLNESTIHSWISTYKREMEHKRKSGEDDLQVKVLPLGSSFANWGNTR